MVSHGTPYDFGGAETDGGLSDPAPDDDAMVIVDGAAMTFRDYLRTRPG